MEKSFLARALGEVAKCCLFVLLFCLLAESLFAVFIQAFSLSGSAVRAVNWLIQAVACLLGGALFLRAGRTLYKGLAAGVLSVLLTMLVFGIIGGFYLDALFLLKLLLGAAACVFGGVIGVKVRKE